MGCNGSTARVEPDAEEPCVTVIERKPTPVRKISSASSASSEMSDFRRRMAAGSSPLNDSRDKSPHLLLPPHMRGTQWKARQRRAEAFDVNADVNYTKKVIPKSEEAKEHILNVTAKNFLFASLDTEQRDEVIGAMFEVVVENGKNVITQGESGDNFYIVDSGEFDIFVKGGDGGQIKVAHVERGGSFGELALMYNTPRAATVTAITDDCKLWAVDRSTFRHLLLGTASRKRKTYEAFLAEVPLLESLTSWERATIADALQPVSYGDGDAIIRQGDEGDRFFFIEKGAAVVTKHGDLGSEEVEVMRYDKGAYFGELALLKKAPRAATVRAIGDTTCVYLEADAFARLLGPCEDIINRKADAYETYEQAVKSPRK